MLSALWAGDRRAHLRPHSRRSRTNSTGDLLAAARAHQSKRRIDLAFPQELNPNLGWRTGALDRFMSRMPTASHERRLSVDDETKVERWLDRKLGLATRPRQAALLIATVTTSITVVSGLLMTLVDHQNFPSFGGGLWWAVQTVTTVGYGDYVPKNVAGRAVATLVMLGGIGFLTVITAAITSGFVARSREERLGGQGARPSAESLEEIAESLHRIEAALTERT